MKYIKTWRERVNEGDSIFAKAIALEAEVAELRAYIDQLHKLPGVHELEAFRQVQLHLFNDWTVNGKRVLSEILRLHAQEIREGRPRMKELRIHPVDLAELELACCEWVMKNSNGEYKLNDITLIPDIDTATLI